MADIIDRIEFELGIKDNTGAEMGKTIPKLRTQAKKAGKDMAALVPEDMSRRLTGMNEKTEVARQLLTQMGGAAGGAAGQLVYYGGSMAKVIGGFSKFEWAAIGVTGAVAALGYGLYNLAREPIQSAINGFDEASKAMRKAKDEAEDALDSMLRQRLGLGQAETAWRKAGTAMSLATNQQAKAQKELSDVQDSWLYKYMPEQYRASARWVLGMDEAEQKARDASSAVRELTDAQRGLTQEMARAQGWDLALQYSGMAGFGKESYDAIQKIMEDRAEKRGSAYAPGKGKTSSKSSKSSGKDYMDGPDSYVTPVEGGSNVPMGLFGIDQGLMMSMAATQQAVQQEHHDALLEQLEEYTDARTSIQARMLDKQAELEENAFRAQEEMARDRLRKMDEMGQAVASMTVGAIDALLSDGLKGLMTYMQEALKIKALDAAAESIRQLFLAFGSYPDYAGMTAHFTSSAIAAGFAALYGAGSVAAGAASGGSSGVGVTSSAEMDRIQSGGGIIDNETQSQVIHIHGPYHVNGNYYSSKDATRQIRDDLDELDRKDNPAKARNRVVA